MDVKNKILREMQNWALAFEAKPLLHYVPQVYKDLKHEGAPVYSLVLSPDIHCVPGFNFPPKDPLVTSSAMVDTKTAPDWIDSEVCLRCRTAFTFTNRKHHCRNCGQVFDQQCSSKSLPLPQFGITQEVRVCDGCYLKLTRQQTKPYVCLAYISPYHSLTWDRHLGRAVIINLINIGNDPRVKLRTPSCNAPSNFLSKKSVLQEVVGLATCHTSLHLRRGNRPNLQPLIEPHTPLQIDRQKKRMIRTFEQPSRRVYGRLKHPKQVRRPAWRLREPQLCPLNTRKALLHPPFLQFPPCLTMILNHSSQMPFLPSIRRWNRFRRRTDRMLHDTPRSTSCTIRQRVCLRR